MSLLMTTRRVGEVHVKDCDPRSDRGEEEGRNKIDSLSWHDPLTTHLIKGMLTFKSGRVGTVFGSTYSNTELVCGHVAGG